LGDYKSALVDVVQDMKGAPVKASVYITGLVSIATLVKTRPTETEFKVLLFNSANDLLMLSDAVRNVESDNYVTDTVLSIKDSRISFWNFGVCTLAYKHDFGRGLAIYESRCKHVLPHWLEMHKHVADVGILGRWVRLKRAMVDYDVNAEEWTADGKAKDTSPVAGS
jgi:hypothetical protein